MLMNEKFAKMVVREAVKALVGSIASVTAMNAVDSAFRAADRRRAITMTEQPNLNPYSFQYNADAYTEVNTVSDVNVSDDTARHSG